MPGVEAAPSSSRSESHNRDDEILDAADAILEDDALNVAMSEIPDEDDTFLDVVGPGVTYDASEGPWVMPEAYSEEVLETPKQEVEKEPESIQYSRETLHGSKAVKLWVKEQSFHRISGADMAKSELENGVANIKRPYLELKQKALERNFKKYQSKKNSSIFAFRREAFAKKARWAKRRLDDTSLKLSKHNQMFGSIAKDDSGNTIKNPGKATELQKKRYLERLRNLELQRGKLIEKQVVAQERKRRRQIKNAARDENLSREQRARMVRLLEQKPSMGIFQEQVHDQLEKELQIRMQKAEKKIIENNHRIKWRLEDNETNDDAILAKLDSAVNQTPMSVDQHEDVDIDSVLPRLENAVNEATQDENTSNKVD